MTGDFLNSPVRGSFAKLFIGLLDIAARPADNGGNNRVESGDDTPSQGASS